MDGKIALEEHWAVDETLHIAGQPIPAGAWWDDLRRLLVEFRDRRLAGKDENGIEFAILGLNSPALQAKPLGHEPSGLAELHGVNSQTPSTQTDSPSQGPSGWVGLQAVEGLTTWQVP